MTGWFGLSGRKFLLAQIPDRTDAKKSTTGILIPEGTASVCRFIARLITDGELVEAQLPIKLFYTTTCFRNELEEELSDTKLRAFGQIGFEFLGKNTSDSDVESILLAMDCLEKIGIPKSAMRIRLGDVRLFRFITDGIRDGRKRYEIQQIFDELSKARAMGLKEKATALEQQAYREISSADYETGKKRPAELIKLVCKDQKNGDRLKLNDRLLDEFGLDFGYTMEVARKVEYAGISVLFDPAVVRGWAYYTETVYQIDIEDKFCFFPEVAGGGRYDTLIGKFAKRYGLNVDIPATGFAFGAERLEELFKKYNPR
jgi:histidyl-tRNA synthetase